MPHAQRLFGLLLVGLAFLLHSRALDAEGSITGSALRERYQLPPGFEDEYYGTVPPTKLAEMPYAKAMTAHIAYIDRCAFGFAILGLLVLFNGQIEMVRNHLARKAAQAKRIPKPKEGPCGSGSVAC